MRCVSCGAENRSDQRFCGDCGGPLVRVCAYCTFENRADAHFCGGCGAVLTATDVRRAPARPGQPPAGHAWTAGEERRHVTILFADIEASTSLIEHLDPEQAATRLKPTLQMIADQIHRFGGTITRSEGDAVMALFGMPTAYEDHAALACFSALGIVDATASDASLKAAVRVGIHSGEVLVQPLGNDLSIGFDVAGVNVHITKRIQEMAPPGAICLSGNTFGLVEGFVRAESLGPQRIRGLQAPIPIWRLIERTAYGSRWQARVQRGLTQFLGRETELATLERALERSRRGEGEVVAVLGGPGIGKSRLVHEFIRSQKSRGTRVIEAAASAQAATTPYRPIANVLREWLGVGEAAEHAAVRESIAAMLDPAGERLSHVRPVIEYLLDMPAPADWADLDPSQRRRRVIGGVTDMIVEAARRRPTLLVVEDLQWIDTETQTVLAHIVRAGAGIPLMVLVTSRPTHAEGWWRGVEPATIELPPLSLNVSRDLLRFLLGEDVSLDGLKRRIAERAEGVPLFLEEIARSLIEKGIVTGERGDYRLEGNLQDIELPDSIQAVIAARIDLLSQDAQNLLQIAAVIGDPAPRALLEAASGRSAADDADSLVELQRAALLYVESAGDSAVVRFRHALIREVAYAGILRRHRKELHARLVGVVERLYGAHLEEQTERLAHHAYLGEVWPQAVKYLARAAIRAIDRSAIREAVILFERGLKALEALPQALETSKAAIDLRLIVVNALLPLGELDEMIRRLREAEEIARAIDDPRRIALAFNQLAVTFWMNGEHALALEVAEEALAAARRLANPPLELAAGFSVGMAHHALGNLAEAIDVEGSLLRALTPELENQRFGWTGYPAVLIRTFLAGTLVETGDFDEARRHLDEGCAIADRLRHPYSQTMIHGILGHLLIETDKADEAVDVLQRMLRLCRDEEVWAMYPAITARLGLAYTRAGQSEKALRLLTDALDAEIYRKGAQYTWLYLFLAMAETCLASARLDDAHRYAEQAEALARRNGEQAHLAHCLKLAGDIRLARGADGIDEAIATYREALALASARGMRPLVAHCNEAIGRASAALDNVEEAEAALTVARDQFDELGLYEAAARAGRALGAAVARAS